MHPFVHSSTIHNCETIQMSIDISIAISWAAPTAYGGSQETIQMSIDRRMDKDMAHIYSGITVIKKRMKSCHLQQCAYCFALHLAMGKSR